jgi:antitoxin MazE
MRITIRRIGNSICITISAPAKSVREGWAEASKALAQHGDDGLVLPEFGNAADHDLVW